MTRSTLQRAAVALALTLCAGVASAHAASFTIDFRDASSSNGSYGNVRTYTDGVLTMTATAWYTTGNAGSSTFAAAALGTYEDYGLGVCNPNETDGPGSGNSAFPCESPNHAVDNDDQYDFVLFLFSQAVNLKTLYLTDIGEDTDISYWVGNTTNPLSLTSKTIGNLTGTLGFAARVDAFGDDEYGLNKNGYNALLVAATLNGGHDGDDAFKIRKLKVDYETGPGPNTPTTPVPEPASFVLLGAGLAGVAAAVRRRRAARA